MAEMAAVLDLHSGPAVVEAAARSYLSLCGEEAAWCSTARAARDSLVQRWVDRLTELLGDSVTVRGYYNVWAKECFFILYGSVHLSSIQDFGGKINAALDRALFAKVSTSHNKKLMWVS